VSGRGNLVRRSEELKKLGAKAKKSIPDNVRSIASQQDVLADVSKDEDGSK
jgi:DNA anti-recombination protein RmuC